MARKTKAELEAERLAALTEFRAKETAEYPMRLMAALEEATTKSNYELEVCDGMFSLRDRDSRNYDNPLRLAPAYTPNGMNDLENLEYDLQSKAEDRAEAERRYLAKQTALSKLTKEEKELLGLQ